MFLGENGYHIDATWGLYGEFPHGIPIMTYFMMSEDERMGDTFYKDTMKATWLWPLKSDYDLSRFPAEDDSYSFLRENILYEGIDTERNVILYTDPDGKKQEFSYENL